MEKEVELGRPSIFATVLWGFGLFIISLAVYSMVMWQGWMNNISDALLVFVAFISGLNAIATGAVIDMHTPLLTIRYKRRKHVR